VRSTLLSPRWLGLHLLAVLAAALCVAGTYWQGVRAFEPDRAALLGLGSAGLIVTAAADPELGDDLVSRYFAPAVGLDEDPVTGSAHCTLGPLWAQRLGRRELSARQVSPRGGRLWLTVDGDRVAVAGHAVTVIRGQVEAAPDRTATATS
jgi:predicted PhzF superfamily epimerase YddE/YHI9